MENKEYVVYVLFSIKYDKIYIGYTSNLEQRLLSHNELSTKGWTVRFRPWKLIYTEIFKDKVSAMKREKELKSFRGREWIRSQFLNY
jgi:putative endonuclease